MVQHTADVAIVGGGLVGSAVALELARAGRDVVVVERAGGIGHGSTSASSGVVRFHYSTFAGVAVSWEAVHGWLDWEGALGYADPAGLATFERTGIVVLDPRPGASDAVTALFDRIGVPWERWDAATITGRLPHVDARRFGPPAPVTSEAFFAEPRGDLTASYTPDAGFVGDPQLAAHNLGAAAERHGARFLMRAETQAIEPDGPRRWLVRTAAGDEVAADVVVNAAGPWSSYVNTLAGIGHDFAVTARPLRQEVHEVPAPAGFDRSDGRPGVTFADPDLGIYVRTAGNGNILIGGMEPECDPLEWLDDPDAFSPQPTRAVFDAQVLRAARRFPGLSVPNRPAGVAGVYDATTDWTPIYDRTAADGYYVAMGTSGNQFKNAPVVGLLMERLIAAVEAGHDHDRTPVCVTLPRTGQVVDLSAFSRLREVDPDAPASVMG